MYYAKCCGYICFTIMFSSQGSQSRLSLLRKGLLPVFLECCLWKPCHERMGRVTEKGDELEGSPHWPDERVRGSPLWQLLGMSGVQTSTQLVV